MATVRAEGNFRALSHGGSLQSTLDLNISAGVRWELG